ncbi:uncharacterized protein YjbK [Sinobaca qinghaiensis]|uniref:Uncharacterized protein YjbK n=1 Tax=Sinobaca qinghaiensis TaxID=342944 RepID=A0A419V6I8_9BACL|nr:CYTH domain-containing protein [Sinobaca qinghaiensis]RKD75579.1 uncharacterized protein YjbK [Sinobaca qinghaiensis]
MAQEYEIEKKNLLTKKEFETLREYLKLEEKDFSSQSNTYFDTGEFSLKQAGAALRVREKGSSAELTLKQKNKNVPGLLETNQNLTDKEKEDILNHTVFPQGEVTEQLMASLQISSEDLQALGTLYTKRASINWHEGEVFLDHSQYLDTEDFEVEIESASEEAVNKLMNKLLTPFSIPVRQAPNKIARFFNRKYAQ